MDRARDLAIMFAAVAPVASAGGCGRLDFDRATAIADGASGATDSPATGDGGAGVSVTLALDRVDPGEALQDFPLLVSLDDSRVDRNQLRSDAADLQFFDTSGAKLGRDIEQIGAAGGAPLIAWVRVPLIAGLSTTLTMTYGNNDIVPSATPAWGDDYLAVYHFAAADVTTIGDDATGRHDATAVQTNGAAGMFGAGVELAGSGYLKVADTSAIARRRSRSTRGFARRPRPR